MKENEKEQKKRKIKAVQNNVSRIFREEKGEKCLPFVKICCEETSYLRYLHDASNCFRLP